MTERYTFHRHVQQPGQGKPEYVEQLKQQSPKCSFEQFENKALNRMLSTALKTSSIYNV